ncbi:MAG: hypothetical protein ACRDYC_05515 [Acidimicrobiales bacterium]
MSDAVRHSEGPHGTGLLPSDLTEEQLAAAPVLASADALVIEDLSDEDYDRFIAALSS